MLTLDHVSKIYRVGTFGGTELVAVRDVNFGVETGQVVSLIGESGSGKTTIGRMILRLTKVSRGSIALDGTDIARLPRRDYYRLVQGVFQDPFSSYNPIFKADHIFGMIRGVYFARMPESEWTGRLEAALEAVGLDPSQVLGKFPHQLSGGQLQRLLIARALLLDIRLLIADEIISMLDASTRIDVLNLLGDLKARGLGILFITHDLSLGYYSSQWTLILQRGTIVEMGATERVYGNPQHPYTRMLIASVPHIHKKWQQVEAELAAAGRLEVRTCVYHDHYPAGRRVTATSGSGVDAGGGAGVVAGTGAVAGIPALAEVEPDHFVGCIHPYVAGTC